MAKIIEIVGTDYYDRSNPHVVLLDGVAIQQEHTIYNNLTREGQKTPIVDETGSILGYAYDFASWLVSRSKARWPNDDESDTFYE